jgi:uncharacterized pyridoxal phosphate-containing UPF0001 family protein
MIGARIGGKERAAAFRHSVALYRQLAEQQVQNARRHHLFINKVFINLAIANLACVETIDGSSKATAMNKACANRSTPLGVFIQINTSGEERTAFSIRALFRREARNIAR